MTTLKEVKDAYKSVFYMKDENDGVLDVILAVTISTWTGNDGIWLLLIGGPSTGKTECLNIITSLPFVHTISTLTENTFLSGMKLKAGQEASLLHRVGPKGVLVFKDFTTVLGLRDDRRTEILNQMREIYDGKIVKSTGNGEDNNWEGKINVLAATTEVIKSIGFSGDYFRVTISGDVKRIPTKIKRKKAEKRNQIKNVLNTGFSVKDLGIGDYYGFEIDGDHLYLLGLS